MKYSQNEMFGEIKNKMTLQKQLADNNGNNEERKEREGGELDRGGSEQNMKDLAAAANTVSHTVASGGVA